MIAPTAAPALSTSGNAASSTLAQAGLGRSFTVTSTTTPEQSLRAGHQCEQVVARGIHGAAADGDALAVGGDHGELEDVVHGQAILQAVKAARVLRHVAADAACDLRGRVRGVVQPERRHVLGNCEVAYSGLHPRHAVDGVHLENPVELREAQQHPVGQRQRAAGQPRARTPRDDRHVETGADPHHLLHLLDGLGEHRDEGDLTVGGKPVTLVGPQILLGVEHGRVGEDGTKMFRGGRACGNRGPAGEPFCSSG